jgi:hypothetical protein
VVSTASDPIARRLVASLNRPGGNATGVTNLGKELVRKQMEKLHQDGAKAAIMVLNARTFLTCCCYCRQLRHALLVASWRCRHPKKESYSGTSSVHLAVQGLAPVW